MCMSPFSLLRLSLAPTLLAEHPFCCKSPAGQWPSLFAVDFFLSLPQSLASERFRPSSRFLNLGLSPVNIRARAPLIPPALKADEKLLCLFMQLWSLPQPFFCRLELVFSSLEIIPSPAPASEHASLTPFNPHTAAGASSLLCFRRGIFFVPLPPSRFFWHHVHAGFVSCLYRFIFPDAIWTRPAC